jgi:hypothetical protein
MAPWRPGSGRRRRKLLDEAVRTAHGRKVRKYECKLPAGPWSFGIGHAEPARRVITTGQCDNSTI